MQGYTQLTQETRYQIHALLGTDTSQAEIARQIGVHPATVSRELTRNRGQRGYRPVQAQRKTCERQRERAQGERISTISEATWSTVEEKLRLDWSPEQVSGWLARQKKAGLAAQTVSHERIYLHIYADKKQGGTLHEHLRCQKKRRKRYGSGRNRRGEIAGRVPIEERPAIVEERTRVGDWELDSIIGKGQQGAIVSLVDRTSRLTLLQKVDARTAELVAAALTQQLKGK